MKHMKKSILVVLFLFLVGCGQQAEENKEITFWNPFTGADGENMQQIIDEYNATEPEYPINNVSIAEADMYSRIPTVVNSGTGIPDLNVIHAERLVQFQESDLLQTFDEHLADYEGITADNYVSTAWDIGEIDGERYSVPLDIHTFALYYNPTLVEEYGPGVIDDNVVTYDEMREVAEAAAEDDVYSFGLTWMWRAFYPTLTQMGGELSEDGVNPTLDTQETRDVFQFYADLYEDGITNPEGTDPLQLFVNDELVFWPAGIWMQNELINSEVEYGMLHYPQMSDDENEAVNWASSHQFVMFNSDERSEEKTKGVMDFIDWIRDNSFEWAKAGQVPASLTLLNNEEYQTMPHAFFVETPERQESMRINDYKHYGYTTEWLNANFLDVIYGRIDVDEAAADFNKEVQDKIDQSSSDSE